MLLFNFIFTACLLFSSEAYEPDRVSSLPGLSGQLKFGTFSGYLDATPGTHLHYIFVESENDPANDPLLLWLNGGPGCSSLLGLFTELGPFRMNESELVVNPYAWNQVANIIFLESPAGVGYSYSDDQVYIHNDDKTSTNNLLALKSWFNKFPQYKDNDFYLTGESYAGVYIPTLSVRLLDEPTINYKGFAIGNGYLDKVLLGNSKIRFAYHHGLIDTSMWYKIVSSCCKGEDESPENCDFVTNASSKCTKAVKDGLDFISNIRINPYGLYENCDDQTGRYLDNKAFTSRRGVRERIGWSLIGDSLNQTIKNRLSVRSKVLPCTDATALINYLSRNDVRETLNIPTFLPDWSDCSEFVNTHYIKQYPTLRDQVTKTIKAGKRVLIYNGDTDLVCDFLGDEWFSDSLGFQQIGEYKAWYVNGQVAGFVKHFRGFAFVTIRGSGHFVPEWRPVASLALIKKFLKNEH
uniref:Carboxypeptidase n=1 Tax=Tetranychus urticae TaxID=32264 RepID=T1KQA4_TETUR